MVKEATGEILKQIRELRGISQKKLAELSNIDRGYINQLEAGKEGSITLRVARALAEALEVSASIFLDAEEAFLEDSDFEAKIFFSHDWNRLDDDEKDWVRRTLRMVRERRREREKYKADKEREKKRYELPE